MGNKITSKPITTQAKANSKPKTNAQVVKKQSQKNTSDKILSYFGEHNMVNVGKKQAAKIKATVDDIAKNGKAMEKLTKLSVVYRAYEAAKGVDKEAKKPSVRKILKRVMNVIEHLICPSVLPLDYYIGGGSLYKQQGQLVG